ncbi:MAG: chemotaxis protein CheW [Candidatus Gracilibacteria bacterium]|nr:chemotaxis protein CheW [Candidatus Gracilibacteria bacterium]
MPAVKDDGKTGSHELIQLVSFILADEMYGVDVLTVREIIRKPTLTKMPNTPVYVDGIINLRGKVIPIISLRRKFNLIDIDDDSQTRIIVMDVNGELTGFTVDGVSEVIRISGEEIQPPPIMTSGGLDQDSIAGVINRDDQLIILLDLKKVFPPDVAAALIE